MTTHRTGVCALADVLIHFGLAVSSEKMMSEYTDADDEISWKRLQDISKKHGVRSSLLRPAPGELRDVAMPAIIRLKENRFFVLAAFTDSAVILIDEEQHRPLALPPNRFAQMWNGEVLTFSLRFNWQHFRKKYNLPWFIQVLKHYKKTLCEVMAAAFFLQIMGIGLPLITQVIIDKVIGNHGVSTLTVIGCSMLIFLAVQSVLTGLRTYLLNHTTNKLDAILGVRLFSHMVSLPLPYYENRRVGDTLARVQALTGIREFLTGQGMVLLLDVLFATVLIAFLLYYSVTLTFITLLVVPLYLVQNIWAIPIVRRKIEDVWRTGVACQSMCVESVSGLETIKSLALEPQMSYRWEEMQSRFARATFESNKVRIALGGCSGLIQTLVSLAVLWQGGHMVMSGEFTLGQLIAFQMVSGQAMMPLSQLLTIWPTVQQVGLALERMGDILNTPMEPVLREQNVNPPWAGNISFRHATFRYRPDLPPTLTDISLDIHAGECVGIVGRSGSGKSTLAKLIQRMYMLDGGELLLDGQRAEKWGFHPLRQFVGVVAQENFLFDRSIRDNIALTRPQASMEEVISAAKLAGAHDFIVELTEGYDTKVGEQGLKLSGGQRQRIAIARALMNNPRILIFDEATSALDYISELRIMENLSRIGAGRTLILIAHRLSTVERCDRIFVLDKGRVAEQGTPRELMARDGIYKTMWRQQMEDQG